MSQRARVLIVEDDERVAGSVRRALEYSSLDVTLEVTVVHDGPTALVVAARDQPDVVILDVMLPGIGGLEVCRALRASGISQPMVLMLTARDATPDRVAGLDAGADDYLVKPFAYEELLARVRALLRRRTLVRPGQSGQPGQPGGQLALADLTLDPQTRRVWRGDLEITLTALQFDLLHHLLRHPGQVLSRQQLLDTVWGGGSAASSNVVDVCVGSLRAKLGEPRLLHTVRGVGYALRVE
jgi:two-component system, OmpR family, response regulator MprA